MRLPGSVLIFLEITLILSMAPSSVNVAPGLFRQQLWNQRFVSWKTVSHPLSPFHFQNAICLWLAPGTVASPIVFSDIVQRLSKDFVSTSSGGIVGNTPNLECLSVGIANSRKGDSHHPNRRFPAPTSWHRSLSPPWRRAGKPMVCRDARRG